MKKVLFIGSILLIAVVSTACINNLAVQDLNNKAKVYMEKGDYTQAIERLKSSIDLEPEIFETRYNLAVAYTKAEDYPKAVDEYEQALKLKPNSPDVYYSLATAQNNLAVDMSQGKIRLNVDDELYIPKAEDIDFDEKYKPSEKELKTIEEYYYLAIDNYSKYLELLPDARDKHEVQEQIAAIKRGLNPQNEE
jgi:tetratricopeptide (TPR) repeat protein